MPNFVNWKLEKLAYSSSDLLLDNPHQHKGKTWVIYTIPFVFIYYHFGLHNLGKIEVFLRSSIFCGKSWDIFKCPNCPLTFQLTTHWHLTINRSNRPIMEKYKPNNLNPQYKREQNFIHWIVRKQYDIKEPREMNPILKSQW